MNGPLTSINASGLATAGVVYQNTGATAQGIFAGDTAMLNLTVLDSIPDNFGSYAGDGLGDDWQVQYFGQNNPNAGPALDPDGDGENNLFEFTAGVIPTDPTSRFVLRIDAVPAQPARKNLVFSLRLNDRTYTVEFRTDLTIGSWTTLGATTQKRQRSGADGDRVERDGRHQVLSGADQQTVTACPAATVARLRLATVHSEPKPCWPPSKMIRKSVTVFVFE